MDARVKVLRTVARLLGWPSRQMGRWATRLEWREFRHVALVKDGPSESARLFAAGEMMGLYTAERALTLDEVRAIYEDETAA